MTPTFKPQSIPELADYVALGGNLEVMGSGTKRGLGRPLQPETAIDMSGFTGISLYEPEELVLEAGAGTPLRDSEEELTKTPKRLEPPTIRNAGRGNRSTLGGLWLRAVGSERSRRRGARHILGLPVSGVANFQGRRTGGQMSRALMWPRSGAPMARGGSTSSRSGASCRRDARNVVFNGLSDARRVRP